MSYLSPLPHYLQPRGRSRSWAHVLPAPLEEETWSDPRLHLHHPLHPERSYHIAGGHQRQFHDVTTIPSLVDLLSPARTSLAAPSKGALEGVDPQALQHAAARLRKTANSESLLLGSEDLPLSRRDWSNDPFNEPLGVDPSRATFPSPSSRPNDPRPLGDLRADSNSLNRLSSTPRPLVLEHSYAPSSFSFFSTHASSSCSTYPSQQHTPFAPFSPPSNFDSRNDFVHREPMIRDARDRIHAYATSTPVDDPFPAPPPSISSTLLTSSWNTRSDFVRELRDQSLTERQRAANLFRKERTSGGRLPFSVDEFYKRADTGDEVDALVRQLRRDLGSSATSTDMCVACGEAVSNSKPGCTALDSLYHVECFKCKTCDKPVAGESFYNVDGAPQCESCYNDALEKCTACGKTISDKLLRACGGQYHVGCFCCVKCSRVLDGVPFTLDSDNRVHCVPCFHDSFAPRCAVCSRPIIPQEGEKESVRVVAMDKSFHVQCYACEDCGVQLSSKVEGAGCYPLDSHLYCRTCNTNRLRLLSSV